MNIPVETTKARLPVEEAVLLSVGICTFRRPSLGMTLRSVAAQTLPDGYRIEVIVADNDGEATLGAQIGALAAETGLEIRYVHAPERNISIARNACLEAAGGDALIFIDDDELAEPDWIARLVETWRASGANVIFGPSHAVYPEGTPDWMVANDVHSNIPLSRGGVVETGYSCNVLLDRRSRRVREARFGEEFGRTGGEDTDFFFRLHRAGVRMGIAMEAVVREPVAQARLSTEWVLRRRYATGQNYGHCVMSAGLRVSPLDRAELALRSAAKVAFCLARALLAAFRERRRLFWLSRAIFHAGVAHGALRPPRRAHYGGAET
ncbi:glycosyltransferase family 2 protein [Celeribacter indicus]|uniref:Succinoglycan biosynthesis protein ExoM n=1 Tax=Celeribacter indicus TaxID=1208324 RepID=A0A0B5DXR3_9RHOB|nr:glycosyltransferase family 2 protein [Celeribacter indicus]AJE47789.1 succinoglycan biosynthesis protein ExoM [Celeribacter indicus]SDW22947.1 succinoglycan biosynthesis protein ExoM [Celeribacter indicus]